MQNTIYIVFHFPDGMIEDTRFKIWFNNLVKYTFDYGAILSRYSLIVAETHRMEREFRFAFYSDIDLSKEQNYGKFMPYYTNLKTFTIENMTTGNKVEWNTNR